jgi:glycosyltransferase involved in cell wall biosynthesis
MKIALIANYPADQQQSMLRYAAFLREELARRGHAVQQVAPGVVAGRCLPPGHKLHKWLGYIDKFILFPLMLPFLVRKAEVVHVCDHSNSPYLGWIWRQARVITCHDALAIRSALGHFAQNPTGGSGRQLQRWILGNLPRATCIIHVSEKTRQDFLALLAKPVPGEVIPHSLPWPYRPADAAAVAACRREFGLEGKDYLLHVGGNQWYKNRLGVLRIYAELKQRERFRSTVLVMAGKPFTRAMRDWCAARPGSDVIELTGLANGQLQALYSGALALLFPSLEEGFGWPILEAQACGCPVITSGRPPMNEIAGDAAIYIAPEEPGAAAETILAALEDRSALREAGLRNVQRFAVEQALAGYEAVYRRAIELARS